jgi:hypothetical protein
MPSFTQHCEETTAALGKPFEEGYRWLDEFAGKPPYGMRHCKLRQQLVSIEQVRTLSSDPLTLCPELSAKVAPKRSSQTT